MNDAQKNSFGLHRGGLVVRVLLVLVLIMQGLILWKLFVKSGSNSDSSLINDEFYTDQPAATVHHAPSILGSPSRDIWAMTRRDPFREMDKMMENALLDMARLRSALHIDDGWDALTASPALDIRDGDSDYIISISLPEMDPDDIDVSLDGRVLRVKAATPVNGETFSSFRSYEQNILLPGPIGSSSNLCVLITNGLLRVTVTKDIE